MKQRRRAPQRAGHRTTLKVPAEILDAARTLAAELGTTLNDAIVRLAEEGASARQRRLEAHRLAQQRRAAVAREGHGIDPGSPSGEALRSAMLGGREAS